MTHFFHPEAEEEFVEAIRYYQAAKKGLGIRFDHEVRLSIQKVVVDPLRWRILEYDVRICRVAVFPYQTLYTIEPHHILILAIMHIKRQPGYWRHRRIFHS